MKKLYLTYPFISRIALALLLGVVAIILGGIIENTINFRLPFPFTVVLLLVVATAIMYKIDHKSLRAIGLTITFKHIAYLIGGLLLGVILVAVTKFLQTIFSGGNFELSTMLNSTRLLNGLYLVLPSVIVQELMFRGYLFTKTIEKTGVVKANIIFAILFALVHVVDRDVLKNPMQIIVLTCLIPVGHLLFAVALLRSKTIFFPIGIHWGNNWAVNHLMGYADNDRTIFYATGMNYSQTWFNFICMLLIFLVVSLALTFCIWKWRRKVNSEL